MSTSNADTTDSTDEFQPTSEMTVAELRAEAQDLQDELDFFELPENQQPEWDRHDEVCRALRDRTDVEFLECRVAGCHSTRYFFTAGDPPVCGNGHEVADADQEREINEASERMLHGEPDEEEAGA